MKTQKEKAQLKKKNSAIKTLKEIITIYKKHYPTLIKLDQRIPNRRKATQIFSLALSQKTNYKPKKCNHCYTKTGNKKTLCNDCIKIPKCKKCEIIMGYWNEDKTLLIYNNLNKPGLINPEICLSCENEQ